MVSQLSCPSIDEADAPAVELHPLQTAMNFDLFRAFQQSPILSDGTRKEPERGYPATAILSHAVLGKEGRL